MSKKQTYKLAVLASGTGTNVRNLLKYFVEIDTIEVAFIGSNKEKAGALQIAENFGIEKVVFGNDFSCDNKRTLLEVLDDRKIDCLVLAGFLRKIPDTIVEQYTDRIINIHPSLLPKHGGKGMYGMNVHKAVKAAHDEETGITIHLVNSEYDKGRILFQAKTRVEEADSPEEIQEKVKQLEADYFPSVIHKFLEDGI